jgi:hypothetical protein
VNGDATIIRPAIRLLLQDSNYQYDIHIDCEMNGFELRINLSTYIRQLYQPTKETPAASLIRPILITTTV